MHNKPPPNLEALKTTAYYSHLQFCGLTGLAEGSHLDSLRAVASRWLQGLMHLDFGRTSKMAPQHPPTEKAWLLPWFLRAPWGSGSPELGPGSLSPCSTCSKQTQSLGQFRFKGGKFRPHTWRARMNGSHLWSPVNMYSFSPHLPQHHPRMLSASPTSLFHSGISLSFFEGSITSLGEGITVSWFLVKTWNLSLQQYQEFKLLREVEVGFFFALFC